MPVIHDITYEGALNTVLSTCRAVVDIGLQYTDAIRFNDRERMADLGPRVDVAQVLYLEALDQYEAVFGFRWINT